MTTYPLPHPNWYQVAPRFLAGEYPGAKEPHAARARVAAHVEAGITYFIDLTEPGELQPYAHLLPERSPVHPLPVHHQRFAICDATVPRGATQMVQILNTIDAVLSEGHTVYLHCWGGIGRTGTVVGCYLARHGQSGDAALRALTEAWQSCAKSAYRDSPETPQQAAWVRGWDEEQDPAMKS